MTTHRVVIVGASGYTGEELVRLVSRHPRLELAAVTSRTYAGQTLGSVVPGLLGPDAQVLFEDLSPSDVAERADIALLALPHGVAADYAVALRAAGKKVVDLSADFRLKDPAVYKEFYGADHPAPTLLQESVYGLPELHRDALATCELIAAPGCYPTSILLPLAPVLRQEFIEPETLVINSLSGVSGAGKKVDAVYLYGEINENMKAYGTPKHRHLSEIEQEASLLAGQPITVTFTPHLVPLHRGMLTTIAATLKPDVDFAKVSDACHAFFVDEPFVSVETDQSLPEVRRVARTNRAEIALRHDSRTNRLLLFSAIDNLGKGAAGQAIQALNVRLGIAETTGLLG